MVHRTLVVEGKTCEPLIMIYSSIFLFLHTDSQLSPSTTNASGARAQVVHVAGRLNGLTGNFAFKHNVMRSKSMSLESNLNVRIQWDSVYEKNYYILK